jgi:hypothetical protein
MKTPAADKFFQNIDFVSIVDTIKGIYTSNGSMSVLLDFERVLDDADVYAYKNWLKGELVHGPDLGRYTTTCIFMWPYKLMPDPRGATRLLKLGCKVEFAKSKIKIPIAVTGYDDFLPGTRYPKMVDRPVWFVKIEVPLELMNDIKEGSIDIAGNTIDLADLEDAYNEDLDKETQQEDEPQSQESELDGPAQGQEPNLGI